MKFANQKCNALETKLSDKELLSSGINTLDCELIRIKREEIIFNTLPQFDVSSGYRFTTALMQKCKVTQSFPNLLNSKSLIM